MLKNIIKKNRLLNTFFSNRLNNLREYLNQPEQNFDKIFSNVVEGELTVKLDNIQGLYKIDSRSHLLKRALITKQYEPSFVQLIKEKTNPVKDAINVGANIGLYTCLLGQLVHENQKVLSIEPTENAFNYLNKNIKKNNLIHKVITFNGVASDSLGVKKINFLPGNEEYSSLGEIIHPAMKDRNFVSIDVNAETIDNLVEKYNLNPGIIVIDVEGAEMQVLSGAKNTIKKFNPIIISELDDLLLEKLGSNSKEIIYFLESLGYNIKDIDNGSIGFPYEGNILATAFQKE